MVCRMYDFRYIGSFTVIAHYRSTSQHSADIVRADMPLRPGFDIRESFFYYYFNAA